jgi:hypothetical protein
VQSRIWLQPAQAAYHDLRLEAKVRKPAHL